MKIRMAALVLVLVAATAAADAPGPTKITACQTIDQPGSYVLIKNLTATGDCLVLTGNYVTIDLAGFLITGNGTGRGITATQAVKGVVIHDGSIIGFTQGIAFFIGANDNITVLRTRINENRSPDGLFDPGINIFGDGAIIRDTNATSNGEDGIIVSGGGAFLSGNVANGNRGNGIVIGSVLSGGSTLIGNTADANGKLGFGIGVGSTIMNNTARGNTIAGMSVDCPSNVIGNTLTGNGPAAIGGTGIITNGLACRLDHNVITPLPPGF